MDLPLPAADQVRPDRVELPPHGESTYRRIAAVLLGADPRRRLRTSQWLFSAAVYAASAGVLWLNMRQQAGHEPVFLGWCAFVVAGLLAVGVAIRSGWSERFADPALTAVQIILGVAVVEWGYLICGPARSLTLFPLLLIFTFGAFSLSWRRILWLTIFALASLLACVVALQSTRVGSEHWSLANDDLRADVSNALMVVILLPALSMVAARLSALRSKLRSQRAALTEALGEVQRLATHDELTGLANRRYIQERLQQEQSRFHRTGLPFSIAIIDLDNFKRINDEQGHAGGDAVLRRFAAVAVETLRGPDLMARWGGEEFLVLLPGARGPQAHASIDRLLARVRQLDHGAGAPLSFSAGVTEYRLDEPVTETVARADREMYDAKQAGRGLVILR